MTLSILSNQNNKNKQVRFKDAIPTNISAIEFNAQTTEVEYLTCVADFAYTSFEIV